MSSYRGWIWFATRTFSLCLLFHFFFSQIDKQYGELVVYGIFIMLNIFSYGTWWMDKKWPYFGEIGNVYIGWLYRHFKRKLVLYSTMDHGPVLCCQSAYGMANTKGRAFFFLDWLRWITNWYRPHCCRRMLCLVKCQSPWGVCQHRHQILWPDDQQSNTPMHILCWFWLQPWNWELTVQLYQDKYRRLFKILTISLYLLYSFCLLGL